MKVYFDVHGALNVEGEDATEWLALRTWSERWSEDASPLHVLVKKPGVPDGPFRTREDDVRQLFRTIKVPPPPPKPIVRTPAEIEAEANNQYAVAWRRELLAYDGKMRNKTHLIDALVVSTRDLVDRLKTAEAKLREMEKP